MHILFSFIYLFWIKYAYFIGELHCITFKHLIIRWITKKKLIVIFNVFCVLYTKTPLTSTVSTSSTFVFCFFFFNFQRSLN